MLATVDSPAWPMSWWKRAGECVARAAPGPPGGRGECEGERDVHESCRDGGSDPVASSAACLERRRARES